MYSTYAEQKASSQQQFQSSPSTPYILTEFYYNIMLKYISGSILAPAMSAFVLNALTLFTDIITRSDSYEFLEVFHAFFRDVLWFCGMAPPLILLLLPLSMTPRLTGCTVCHIKRLYIWLWCLPQRRFWVILAVILKTIILVYPIGFCDLRISGCSLAVQFELRCQTFMIATITQASSWILSTWS